MRSFLRRTALTLAAGSLILWCSCERHHVGELGHPGEEGHHSEAKADTQADHAEAHEAGDHAHHSPAPAASPAATAANFFPTATPH